MFLAIIGITSFQVYWMRNLYEIERAELRKETDFAFRDVVYKLQMQQLKNDPLFIKHDLPPNLFLFNLVDSLRTRFIDSSGPGPRPGESQKLTISVQEFDMHDSVGQQ